MLNKIISVYDSKAGIFNQPMYFISTAEAVRSFIDQVNTKDSAIQKHPEDYTLFLIGEFNLETGELIKQNTPVSLGLAQDYTDTNTIKETKS